MIKMRFFIYCMLLCTLFSFAGAAGIKNISVHSTAKERLDVLLMLDSTFKGEIGATTVQNKKMTLLTNITLPKTWSQSFANAPIRKLTLVSRNNSLYIDIESNKQYQFKPSISKDKNTIRLSFLSADSKIANNLLKTPATLKPTPIEKVFNNNTTPQQPESSEKNTTFENLKVWLEGNNLYYALGFGGAVVVLLLLSYQVRKSSKINSSIKIAAQNQIDSKNKIIIFETRDYFYMVLMGEKSNVLIDKIARGKINEKRAKSAGGTTQTIGSDETFNDEFWNSLIQGNLIKK